MLGGYRRTAADRGRGQAAPLRADGLAAILATAARPRTDGRGVESHTTAQRRGRLDAVIASLLFMGGLRRSEVSALEWRDVSDASDGDGVLLTVRTSKTNQEGDAADVRYLKNGAAKAIRTLRAAAADAAPTDRVIGLSPLQIQRRFTAAARAAGIEARVTAHSGRVGLASELTVSVACEPLDAIHTPDPHRNVLFAPAVDVLPASCFLSRCCFRFRCFLSRFRCNRAASKFAWAWRWRTDAGQ